MMTPKVLAIGLDGGTYDLLLPLVEQGIMPHMAKFLQQGSWGRLESTIPPFTGTAWSTFATGLNPGQHGILSFQKHDRFNYYEQIVDFVDANQLHNPFWHTLGEAGKRVVIVNVPVTYPPRPVNGMMITGMMTPKNASQFTYPRELAEQLGEYQIDVDFIHDEAGFRIYGLPPKEVMLSEIHHVTKTRTQACLRLLQTETWDFFTVVYTGTDRLSHFFWDDLVKLLAQPTEHGRSPLQDGLITYFRDLDEGIGKLIAAAGPDAHILFMSDHGFGPSPTKRFYINVWLEQIDL
ncbi:MAG: alkaline phosphatase family protein, partial [Anaerolineales bacterium]|nr:alkaline phosphatase family protein [Anaerolineales bacterium]